VEQMCPECTKGPSRIDGHPNLIVQMMGNAGMTFKCVNCSTRWSRNYRGEGDFQWVRVDPQAPADLRSSAHGLQVP
jgi:hypothetical protein